MHKLGSERPSYAGTDPTDEWKMWPALFHVSTPRNRMHALRRAACSTPLTPCALTLLSLASPASRTLPPLSSSFLILLSMPPTAARYAGRLSRRSIASKRGSPRSGSSVGSVFSTQRYHCALFSTSLLRISLTGLPGSSHRRSCEHTQSVRPRSGSAATRGSEAANESAADVQRVTGRRRAAGSRIPHDEDRVADRVGQKTARTERRARACARERQCHRVRRRTRARRVRGSHAERVSASRHAVESEAVSQAHGTRRIGCPRDVRARRRLEPHPKTCSAMSDQRKTRSRGQANPRVARVASRC